MNQLLIVEGNDAIALAVLCKKAGLKPPVGYETEDKFKNEFVKTQDLPVLQLPATLRKSDPNLIFQPYYRLESKTNKNILIQVGPKVFSVAITNDYTGWEEFLKYINLGLSKLEESGVMMPVLEYKSKYIRPAKYDDLLTIIND